MSSIHVIAMLCEIYVWDMKLYQLQDMGIKRCKHIEIQEVFFGLVPKWS